VPPKTDLKGPCDLPCDLDSFFWHFPKFYTFVTCITCVFSISCKRTSPPLRTIFYSTTYGRLPVRPFLAFENLVRLSSVIAIRST
jgi:hypothetical protein